MMAEMNKFTTNKDKIKLIWKSYKKNDQEKN